MGTSPFVFVEAISYSKADLLEENPELEKDYIPFIVNKSLSYHLDALQHANEMNLYYDTDKKLQFDYLRHALRSRKRFAKWVKKPENAGLKNIQQYYSCNEREAEEILGLLSEDDLKKINDYLEPGGR